MSPAMALVVSARPRQWTKNLVVFAPLIFSGAFSQTRSVVLCSSAFLVMCALSSAGYLLNDARDAASDRQHPSKRDRPVASGALTVPLATGTAALLAAGALGGSLALGARTAALAVGFALLQAAYTFVLRRFPIIDTMTIAAGFVLRAMVGAAAIHVPDSEWLLACAALLALFLALAKRRNELIVLGAAAVDHRASLAGSSPALLDEMIAAVAGATIVSYSVYAYFVASAEGHRYMMATVPFVIYGLFRYLHLVHARNLGGSPEEILLSDVPLIVDILCYVVAVLAIMSLT